MIKNKAVVSVLTVLGAVALFGTAQAGSTTVRTGSASGAPYSGTVNGSLASSTAVFESSLGTVTCNTSTLTGTTTSDGSDVDISDATWNYNNGACQNTLYGTTEITALGLPWSNGSVVYSPVSNGRDGVLTIAGVSVRSVRGDGTTCYWIGAGTGGSIALDVYNPDNKNRPVSSVAVAQAHADTSLARDNSKANSTLCPSSATMKGTYRLKANDGSSLYITS